jgi:hypothetical protein
VNESFPIMMSGYSGDLKETYGRLVGPIFMNVPWQLLAPHESQALRNHSQTLKRLAERGGLAPCEAVAILEDRPWRPMTLQQAYTALAGHVSRVAPPPEIGAERAPGPQKALPPAGAGDGA